MKYLKNFNESLNNSNSADSIKKKFDKPTLPEKPFKRKLTKEEMKKMEKHFKNHSWSDVDNKGRIILGGGVDKKGMFYIDIEDLDKLK